MRQRTIRPVAVLLSRIRRPHRQEVVRSDAIPMHRSAANTGTIRSAKADAAGAVSLQLSIILAAKSARPVFALPTG